MIVFLLPSRTRAVARERYDVPNCAGKPTGWCIGTIRRGRGRGSPGEKPEGFSVKSGYRAYAAEMLFSGCKATTQNQEVLWSPLSSERGVQVGPIHERRLLALFVDYPRASGRENCVDSSLR